MKKYLFRKLKSIKKVKSDNFINRLRSTVIGEGMLHEGNIFLIDFAIRNLPDNGIIMEIGSYGGLSTNLILHLLKKYNKNNIMVGCDAWIYEGYNDFTGNIDTFMDGRKDVSRVDYMEYIKKSFVNVTQLLHKDTLPYTCHLKSDDFFRKWYNEEKIKDVFNRTLLSKSKFAFAYIDGDHSYEQSKKDFKNVAKNLLIGGYVLIDDSADYMSFGSVKYTKEILKMPNFKLIYKNPNYLFQRIK